MNNFVLLKGKFQADEGWHDDLVMTLINFSWASTTTFFRELTKVDIRDVFIDKLKEIQDELVPFGFVYDSYEGFDPDPFDF